MLDFSKAAEDVGIMSVTRKLSKSTTEDELISIVEEMNSSDSVDGILVQLPLPDHINERKVVHVCIFV
jgi:methylenetetrahydrofolate dehydrogenase (NADP+) / methenyltetrahydrofolate cyclohydrolase